MLISRPAIHQVLQKYRFYKHDYLKKNYEKRNYQKYKISSDIYLANYHAEAQKITRFCKQILAM